MAGIENPEIKKQSNYTRGIEEQLVILAEIISDATYSRGPDVVLAYHDIKKELDTLQMLCYNVLIKYKGDSNKETIDTLAVNTSLFLKRPMPRDIVAFQVFFRDARDLYMTYNKVLINCGAIKA